MRGALLTLISLVHCLLSCNDPDASPEMQGPVQHSAPLKPSRGEVQVVQLEQIERKSHSSRFQIPKFEQFQDDFYQADKSLLAIDILIVVDNSGSMAWAQGNMASKMAPLLEAVQDVSWQIGVINTEWPCFIHPKLPFTIETANLARNFSDSIRQGTSGSGIEKAMVMAGLNITQKEYTSVDPFSTKYEKACTPEPWLRENASFAMLILADEDEDPSSEWTVEMFFNALKEQGYNPGHDARVSGLIWRPGTECPEASRMGGNEGHQHNELIEMTGGISGSVCDKDYTQSLKAISANFRDLIHYEYQLREQPLLSTVEIEVNGAPYLREFTIVGSKLILREPLEPQDRMEIRYKVEEARRLQLPQAVDPQSLVISIGDKTITEDSYRYDPRDHSIHFSEALPEGQKIIAAFKESTALKTEFPFPPRVPESAIECYYQGELVGFRYLYEEGLIVLDEPQPDGEAVYCLYQR